MDDETAQAGRDIDPAIGGKGAPGGRAGDRRVVDDRRIDSTVARRASIRTDDEFRRM